MKIEQIPAYELIKEEMIEDIHAKGYLLSHKKTKARVLILENDDENKVFNIAFRTPPTDSTGVAHIIEHSVLCGSKNFPLKDPFVELVKGSLNTFLNAMTYPDKTMYPVASCNDQDFKNLMHVYMDAVFYPNIYQHEEIFLQEGWSYHLEKEEEDLTYNGVVYSEMKGAFSSPEEVLDRAVFSSLFPDNTYGVESGGDPDDIPNLTYEQFLDFHRKYYHPSNSYIYLYGNANMEERLNWMDEEYLSKFEAQEIDSKIPYQKSFEKPCEVELAYPIGEDEEEEENTYLSYNIVVGDSLDIELCTAFEILEYALLSAPGAPLKQILLDEKIGKDVYGSYQDGILQPFFSIVAKNANPDMKDEFVKLIQEMVEKLIAEGIDKKALRAGINYFEFRFREADFSSYPKGLMYGIDVFDSWLYDDERPFIHLQKLAVFETLKEKVETRYFEELLEKYFEHNDHVSLVVVVPEKGLAAKKEEELAKKLEDYKKSLTKGQIEELIKKTEGLKEYQEAEETAEALSCIPMLKREDIKKETMELYNEEKQIGDTKVLHHNLYTNGIGYLTLLFSVDDVPEELVPYLGILKSVMGYVDTKRFTYGELFNEINASTGGISCGISVFNAVGEKPYQSMFGIKSKALYEKMDFVFEMIEEIINSSDFHNEKRLYEIIAEIKSRMQMSMASAGHSTAASRACSYFSGVSYFQEQISGIDYYHLVSELEENFDERKDELIEKLESLRGMIFNPEKLVVSFVSDDDGYVNLQEALPEFVNKLNGRAFEKIETSKKVNLIQKNEAFTTPGQVQYVAKAGNFKAAGFEYTGALHILKVILSYDYLWMNVRVKGGAYGCMSGFKRTGDSYFVSYRDPKLESTLEIFDRVPEYLESFEVDEREMTKYVIGTISGFDTPMTPATKGAVSLSAYFNHIDREQLQKERNQILNVKVEDIRSLAPMMRAILSQNNICVVGSESMIEKSKELFKTVENLK